MWVSFIQLTSAEHHVPGTVQGWDGGIQTYWHTSALTAGTLGTQEKAPAPWREGFQEEVMLLKTQSPGRRGLIGC